MGLLMRNASLVNTRQGQLNSFRSNVQVWISSIWQTRGYSQERSGDPCKHGYQCSNAWQPAYPLRGGRFQPMVQLSVVSSIIQ